MNTHADKAQENKIQSLTDGVSRKQSGSEPAFQFADNRPKSVAQRKLQELANNIPRTMRLKAFQNTVNSPQAKQAAQLQATADNNSARQQQPIQKKENNTGLPDNLKTGMENLSGMSLDDVKVHRNSDKPAQLQARAYAQGADIHLGTGKEKHLPHEAWHVVQQKQGRVKPTAQLKGKAAINDDAGLEQEADQMGAKALSFKSTEAPQIKEAGIAGNPTYQLLSAKVKGVTFGQTNVYNGKGNKVAKVAKGQTIEVNENDFVIIPGKKLVYLSSGADGITWNDPNRLLNDTDANDLWISATRYTIEEEEAEEDGVELSAGRFVYKNGEVTIPIWGDHAITVGRSGASAKGALPSKTIGAPLPSVDIGIDIPFAPGAYATAGLKIKPNLSLTISGGTYKTTVGEVNSLSVQDAGVSGKMGLAITASAGVGAGVANLVGLEGGIFATLGGEATLAGTIGGTADFTNSNYKVDLGVKASADIIGKAGVFIQAKFSIFKARKEYSLAEKKFAHFDYERNITLGKNEGTWKPEITDFTKTEYGDKSSAKKLKTVDGQTYEQLLD